MILTRGCSGVPSFTVTVTGSDVFLERHSMSRQQRNLPRPAGPSTDERQKEFTVHCCLLLVFAGIAHLVLQS